MFMKPTKHVLYTSRSKSNTEHVYRILLTTSKLQMCEASSPRVCTGEITLYSKQT